MVEVKIKRRERLPKDALLRFFKSLRHLAERARTHAFITTGMIIDKGPLSFHLSTGEDLV